MAKILINTDFRTYFKYKRYTHEKNKIYTDSGFSSTDVITGMPKKTEPAPEKQTLDYATQACTDITVVSNARQLGGYINSEGLVFKQNVLIRSGNLASLNASGIEVLQDKYKVCDIIDLRYEREINANTADKEVPGATYHLFQLAHSKATSEALFANNQELYDEFISLQRNARTPEGSFAVTKFQWEHGMLSSERMIAYFESEEAIESYKQIFEVLLNKPEDAAILIHCAGGKGQNRYGMHAVAVSS